MVCSSPLLPCELLVLPNDGVKIWSYIIAVENFSSPQKQPGPGRYRPVKPHLTACWSPIGDQCLPGKSWRYSLNLLSKIPESPSGLAEIYHLAGEFYITTLLGYQTDRQTGVIRVRLKPSQHSFSYFQSSSPCSLHTFLQIRIKLRCSAPPSDGSTRRQVILNSCELEKGPGRHHHDISLIGSWKPCRYG